MKDNPRQIWRGGEELLYFGGKEKTLIWVCRKQLEKNGNSAIGPIFFSNK